MAQLARGAKRKRHETLTTTFTLIGGGSVMNALRSPVTSVMIA
jgi:hypothetical protein